MYLTISSQAAFRTGCRVNFSTTLYLQMLKPEEEEELIGEDSAISADESTENSSAQNQTEHQVSVHDASALTDVFL